MIAKENALRELSRYGEKYRPSYSIIDPLIKPLCELLTKHDYITMHSCSSHVRIRSYKAEMIAGNLPLMTEEEKKHWIHSKAQYWYILFVAAAPINEIIKVVNIINYKYGYELKCKKTDDFEDVTERWVINSRYVDSSFNDDDIYDLNKNIYLEFKDYFDNK